MSKYIKKLETDYDEGKISRDEFINSKLDYYKNWDTVKYEELKNELNNEKNDFNKSKNKILSKKTTNDFRFGKRRRKKSSRKIGARETVRRKNRNRLS